MFAMQQLAPRLAVLELLDSVKTSGDKVKQLKQ